MNTSKNSNGWMWLVIAVLMATCIGLGIGYKVKSGQYVTSDSTLFNSAREVVTRYIRERDIALEKLKQSDLARADWKVYAMQADAAYKNQIKDLKRIISDHVKAK